MPCDPFRYADELGPANILHLHEPAFGLKAIVVVDKMWCWVQPSAGCELRQMRAWRHASASPVP